MGTIMNGGVRVPTVTIEHLRFAANTPYDTSMSPSAQPQRVMPPEVAATVRRALTGIVSSGTARRLSGTYTADDGTPLPVGGKTGTGDNRFERFGPGGGLISSRVVDRTATFVFFLGDRFFGTVTAYVPGNDAESFGFTSAIAVQLLKALKPEVEPLINKKPVGAPMLVGSSRRNRGGPCHRAHERDRPALHPAGRRGRGGTRRKCRSRTTLARPPDSTVRNSKD